ncbi:MAG: MarR family winged helix-turn-helix transcriptional regulator [Acidobacteriia bacterium]|nr:MarR family winged helix-turn-helix transcriptional regulator [Terriglobia bacterium]
MTHKTESPSLQVKQIAEECIAVRLRLLTRAVTRLYNQALRPHGLTVSQMNILVAASCLGQARPRDICRVLHLEKSTLSRDVERMRLQGWLKRSAGEDGRTSLLQVTTAGARFLEKAIPAWREAQQRARALLGEQGWSVLDRTAAALRRGGLREQG